VRKVDGMRGVDAEVGETAVVFFPDLNDGVSELVPGFSITKVTSEVKKASALPQHERSIG
jgi:hypothetical protein